MVGVAACNSNVGGISQRRDADGRPATSRGWHGFVVAVRYGVWSTSR